MKLKHTNLMAAALAGFVMIATSVPAQEQTDTGVVKARFQVDDGGAVRIGISGKLRMLSQMVPAAACQVASGYDPEYAAGILTNAAAEFEHILDALEFGDPELGVPTAEERRITLAAIQNVREAWVPLHTLVEDTLSGDIANLEEDLAHVLDDSGALLNAAKALVVEEVAEYSNPSQMAQAESFLIDIAGRQRMLIQKMSKDACLVLHRNSEDEGREDLVKSMATFETTLAALQTGMPSVGLRPPPNAAIEEGLAGVAADWQAIKPLMDHVVEGADITPEEVEHKFRSLNELMATMNAVVGLYAATVAG